jgi:hypothetical protein
MHTSYFYFEQIYRDLETLGEKAKEIPLPLIHNSLDPFCLQSRALSNGYAPWLIDHECPNVLAHWIAHLVRAFGQNGAKTRSHWRDASRALKSLANPKSSDATVRRAAINLLTISCRTTLLAGAPEDCGADLLPLLRRLLTGDWNARQEITVIASRLAPLLTPPRGPSETVASIAHQFFLETFVGLFGGKPGYTRDPVLDQFTDPLTEATRLEFDLARFDPRPAIRRFVSGLKINCNFRRLDAYLFPGPETKQSELDDELKAQKKCGVSAEKVRGVPGVIQQKGIGVLHYRDQATFHPARYLRGLAETIAARGGKLFADTIVTEVEEKDGAVAVRTQGGDTIECADCVVATNSPINDRVALHTKMAPYRTYAMAFTIPKDALPDALYWDTMDPYHK